MDIRAVVMMCLEESGLYIFAEKGTDVNLNEYEIDSLSFVSFIICLEEKLNISIPEDFLHVDVLQSLDGFVLLITQLVADQTGQIGAVEQI